MSRFAEPQDPDFASINRSLDVDRRLWPYDVAQSRAHARMLAAQGIIDDADRDALLAGLDAVEVELRGGTLPVPEDDEDIHMAVERRLTELAGPVGGKLHTARSRNDQVATDVALFVREAALEMEERIADLMAALLDAAEAHLDWPLPGLHAPAACAAGLPRPSPPRVRLDARARPQPLPVRRGPRSRTCRSARARWRA